MIKTQVFEVAETENLSNYRHFRIKVTGNPKPLRLEKNTIPQYFKVIDSLEIDPTQAAFGQHNFEVPPFLDKEHRLTDPFSDCIPLKLSMHDGFPLGFLAIFSGDNPRRKVLFEIDVSYLSHSPYLEHFVNPIHNYCSTVVSTENQQIDESPEVSVTQVFEEIRPQATLSEQEISETFLKFCLGFTPQQRSK